MDGKIRRIPFWLVFNNDFMLNICRGIDVSFQKCKTWEPLFNNTMRRASKSKLLPQGASPKLIFQHAHLHESEDFKVCKDPFNISAVWQIWCPTAHDWSQFRHPRSCGAVVRSTERPGFWFGTKGIRWTCTAGFQSHRGSSWDPSWTAMGYFPGYE